MSSQPSTSTLPHPQLLVLLGSHWREVLLMAVGRKQFLICPAHEQEA
jgi:hypothetical protein